MAYLTLILSVIVGLGTYHIQMIRFPYKKEIKELNIKCSLAISAIFSAGIVAGVNGMTGEYKAAVLTFVLCCIPTVILSVYKFKLILEHIETSK